MHTLPEGMVVVVISFNCDLWGRKINFTNSGGSMSWRDASSSSMLSMRDISCARSTLFGFTFLHFVSSAVPVVVATVSRLVVGMFDFPAGNSTFRALFQTSAVTQPLSPFVVAPRQEVENNLAGEVSRVAVGRQCELFYPIAFVDKPAGTVCNLSLCIGVYCLILCASLARGSCDKFHSKMFVLFFGAAPPGAKPTRRVTFSLPSFPKLCITLASSVRS